MDVLEGGPGLGRVGKEAAQLAQGLFLFGPGVQEALEGPCLLYLAGFTHHLLVLFDAFLHGLVDLVPFLAFLQFKVIRAVRGKGQFLCGIGQQGHGRLHDRGGIAEQRPGGGRRGSRPRGYGGTALLLLDGKIDAHGGWLPVTQKVVGNMVCYMPKSCHIFLVA